MFSDEQLTEMAGYLRIDPVTFIADAKATEVKPITFTAGLQIFDETQLATRDNNKKGGFHNAGKEMFIKDMKETLGLEFDGKDPGKLFEAYKAKVLAEGGIVESEKLKKKDVDFAALQANYKELEKKYNGAESASKATRLDNELLTMTIAQKPDNLSPKQWLAVLKADNELAEVDGKIVVMRDGKVVADNTLVPLAAADVIGTYIKDSKIGKDFTPATPAAGGRGAGSSQAPATGGISKMSQFEAHLKEQNIEPTSQKAQHMLAEITKANTTFDYAS